MLWCFEISNLKIVYKFANNFNCEEVKKMGMSVKGATKTHGHGSTIGFHLTNYENYLLSTLM